MLPIIHLNRQEIGLKTFYYVSFDFNRIIYQLFKSLETISWDNYEKCWVFDEAHYSLKEVYHHFEGKAEFVLIEKKLESVEFKKHSCDRVIFWNRLTLRKKLKFKFSVVI